MNNLLSSIKTKTASVLERKKTIVTDGDEFDNLVFDSDDEQEVESNP